MAAQSERAGTAEALVSGLQERFVEGLSGCGVRMERVDWLRDGGRHGGGHRYGAREAPMNRASVNVSSVHYDDEPARRLSSATALSTIVHPAAPRAPSVHIHVSWTEMRDGQGYWRIMADLNPSMPDEAEAEQFRAALRDAAPTVYEEASAQGDKYFYIPALKRHRGVAHFYLEGYRTESFDDDSALARSVGEAAIDAYLEIFTATHAAGGDTKAQLDYHTLYFFQVLTLDRGTTSGLLVHDQNDVGILGSLPSHLDRDLLASWRDLVPAPQEELVDRLLSALPEGAPCAVTDELKPGLAQAVREHYRAHPEALDLQAAGNIVPPTVDNHGRT